MRIMVLGKILLVVLALSGSIQGCYTDVKDSLNKKTRGISFQCGDASLKGKTFFAYALLDKLRFSFQVDEKESLGEFTLADDPIDTLYTFNTESVYFTDLLTFNGVVIDRPKTFFYLLEVLPDNIIEVELKDTLHLKNTFDSKYSYRIKPIVDRTKTNNGNFRIALRFNDHGAIVTLIEKKNNTTISSTILEESSENTFITEDLNFYESEWLIEVKSQYYSSGYDAFFQVDLINQFLRESEIDNNPEYVVPYQYFYKTVSSIKGQDDFIVDFPADVFNALDAIIYQKIHEDLIPVKKLELTEENRIRVDIAKELGNEQVNQDDTNEYVLKIKFYTKTVPKVDNDLLIAKYNLEEIFEETPGLLLRGNFYDNQAFVKIPSDLLKGNNIVLSYIYEEFTNSFLSDIQIGYDEVPKLSDTENFGYGLLLLNTLEVDQEKIINTKYVYVGIKVLQKGSFIEFELLITHNVYKFVNYFDEEIKFSLEKGQSLYLIYEKEENYNPVTSITSIEASSEDYVAFTNMIYEVEFEKYKFTSIKRFFTFNVNDRFKKSKTVGLKKSAFTKYHFLKLTANSDISGVAKVAYSSIEGDNKKVLKYLK